MTESVIKLLENALTAAGFEPHEEYRSDSLPQGVFAAVYAVRRITLGEFVTAQSSQCRADFTLSVRLCAKKRGYYDAEELSEMAQRAMRELIFSSTLVVRELELGRISPNTATGRLEYPLTAVISAVVSKE